MERHKVFSLFLRSLGIPFTNADEEVFDYELNCWIKELELISDDVIETIFRKAKHTYTSQRKPSIGDILEIWRQDESNRPELRLYVIPKDSLSLKTEEEKAEIKRLSAELRRKNPLKRTKRYNIRHEDENS